MLYIQHYIVYGDNLGVLFHPLHGAVHYGEEGH